MAYVKGLSYRDNCTLTPQVRRYLETFGDRVHIVLLEDMAVDQVGVFRGVLELLGVDPDFVPPNMGVFNPSKAPRYPLLRRVPSRVRGARHLLKRILPGPLQGLIAVPLRVRQLNKKEAPRAPLSPELESELVEFFALDVAALGELIGRDLGRCWPRFAPPSDAEWPAKRSAERSAEPSAAGTSSR